MKRCMMCRCPIYDEDKYVKFRRKNSEYLCYECSEEVMQYASIGLLVKTTDAELYLYLLDERQKMIREMRRQD